MNVRFQVLTAASMMFRVVFWQYNPEDNSEHHKMKLSIKLRV
jgi:hypothetical protein